MGDSAPLLTSTMSTPQVHLAGVWLIELHVQPLQAHMYLPTVLRLDTGRAGV